MEHTGCVSHAACIPHGVKGRPNYNFDRVEITFKFSFVSFTETGNMCLRGGDWSNQKKKQ